MMHSLEELEKMEALGFKLLGPIFKDTLAYIQIQREKKEAIAKRQEENAERSIV